MKLKLLFTIIIFICSLNSLNCEVYKVTNSDVEMFLSIADDYLNMAAKYITNDEKKLTLDGIFYLNNMKLLNATQKFLKSKGWTFEEMNNFLYVTGVILDSIPYWDEYDIEDEDKGLTDISLDSIEVVRNYKVQLSKYIGTSNFSDIDPYGDYDNYNLEDYYSENTIEDKNENPVRNTESVDNMSDFIGKFAMDIRDDNKTGYNDAIIIENITNNEVEGELIIDWDIGTQARIPMEWEMIYKFPFKYKLNGNSLNFKVIVAEKYINASEYIFDITLEKEHNVKPVIKGTVKITMLKSKSFSNHTVRAEKK